MKPIPLGKPGVIKPMSVLLSRDASKLYVSTGRGQQLFTVDTATNSMVGSVTVCKRPWGIALSPDGKTLYSANRPSNDISVVDLQTNTVTGSVKVCSAPWVQWFCLDNFAEQKTGPKPVNQNVQKICRKLLPQLNQLV